MTTRLAIAIGLLLFATSVACRAHYRVERPAHPTVSAEGPSGRTRESKGRERHLPQRSGHQAGEGGADLLGPGAVWGTSATRSPLAQHIIDFFVQFGTNPQYNVITQYYDTGGSIQLANLTTTYVVDNSTTPTNVSDATLQGEVAKIASQIGADARTVYEVFLPPTSYASYGSANSCGGPNLQFCAYHSNFTAVRRRPEVRFDAVSELRRMSLERMDRRAELRSLLVARDARGGDRSRRQRLVRSPGIRGRRQVRVVAVALHRERLRVPVRVVEPARRVRHQSLIAEGEADRAPSRLGDGAAVTRSRSPNLCRRPSAGRTETRSSPPRLVLSGRVPSRAAAIASAPARRRAQSVDRDRRALRAPYSA